MWILYEIKYECFDVRGIKMVFTDLKSNIFPVKHNFSIFSSMLGSPSDEELESWAAYFLFVLQMKLLVLLLLIADLLAVSSAGLQDIVKKSVQNRKGEHVFLSKSHRVHVWGVFILSFSFYFVWWNFGSIWSTWRCKHVGCTNQVFFPWSPNYLIMCIYQYWVLI